MVCIEAEVVGVVTTTFIEAVLVHPKFVTVTYKHPH